MVGPSLRCPSSRRGGGRNVHAPFYRALARPQPSGRRGGGGRARHPDSEHVPCAAAMYLSAELFAVGSPASDYRALPARLRWPKRVSDAPCRRARACIRLPTCYRPPPRAGASPNAAVPPNRPTVLDPPLESERAWPPIRCCPPRAAGASSMPPEPAPPLAPPEPRRPGPATPADCRPHSLQAPPTCAAPEPNLAAPPAPSIWRAPQR